MESLDSDLWSVWTLICGAFGLRFVGHLDSDLWSIGISHRTGNGYTPSSLRLYMQRDVE